MAQNGRPSTRERGVRQSEENRSGCTNVLADPRGSSNYGYAYHRVDEDGSPLCRPTSEGLEEMTINRAQRKGKTPCQMCDRISEDN